MSSNVFLEFYNENIYLIFKDLFYPNLHISGRWHLGLRRQELSCCCSWRSLELLHHRRSLRQERREEVERAEGVVECD